MPAPHSLPGGLEAKRENNNEGEAFMAVINEEEFLTTKIGNNA